MLVYTSEELIYFNLGEVELEGIVTSYDLMAALMCNSLDIWESQYTLKVYNTVEVVSDKVVGNINYPKSYMTGALNRGEVVCDCLKLDIDNEANQLIKLGLSTLLQFGDEISDIYRIKLVNSLADFNGVSNIGISRYNQIMMSGIDFPLYYKPVICAVQIIIDNIMARVPVDGHGDSGEVLFRLEDSSRYQYIFEKFVRRLCEKLVCAEGAEVEKTYYRLYDAENIEDDDGKYGANPDIVVRYKGKSLLIDTKWYTESIGNSNNRLKMVGYCYLESGRHKPDSIKGMTLYAKPAEYRGKITLTNKPFKVSDSTFIKDAVIDMNVDFEQIKDTIIKILVQEFGEEILG